MLLSRTIVEENMLTDNPNTKHRKPKIRSIEAETNRTWSDKQKIEAVQSYLLLGNLSLTGRVLGISEVTLRKWKASDWWQTVVEDIKLQESIQLSNRLKKIANMTLGVVEDRVENGDYLYDGKTGQMVRKPVSLKDAHKVATDLIAKNELIAKTAEPAAKELSEEGKWEKLAEKFAGMVNKKIEMKEQSVVDVPMVEIVPKESSNG